MCACVCEFVRVLWLQVGVSVCGWNEDVSEEKDTLEKEIKKKGGNTYHAMMLVDVSLLCATRRLVCHRPK